MGDKPQVGGSTIMLRSRLTSRKGRIGVASETTNNATKNPAVLQEQWLQADLAILI